MKLEIRNLSFSYGRNEVLKELSLEAESGTFIAILAENGEGKTTLFKNLLGILKPDGGQILIDGKEISTISPRERARLLAYIPQESRSTFPYTVFTSVLMGTSCSIRPLGSPGKREEERCEEAMKLCGIEELRNRSVDTLSGGERQLVLTARAVAQGAPILLFDEPASSLDYGNQARVLSLIRALTDKGALALVSTHNIQDALNRADRILLLKDGRIMADGEPGKIVREGSLSDFYSLPLKILEISGHYFCQAEGDDVVE